MGRETLPQLFARSPKRRPFAIRNQVIYGQVLTIRFEPTQDGSNIIVPLVGLNRTEERVLENPIETQWRRIRQKIPELKLRRQTGLPRSFSSQGDGAGRDIIAEDFETCSGPGSNVMTRAAAWNANRPTRQLRVRGQKIDQSRRGRSFLPGHVA